LLGGPGRREETAFPVVLLRRFGLAGRRPDILRKTGSVEPRPAAGRSIIAKRSSSTFVKRQKEMARKEKQKQKMERRLERRQNRGLVRPEGEDLAGQPAPDGPIQLPSIEEAEEAEDDAADEPRYAAVEP
jgi:hypothetical protein